jgi:hypothetical protein
MCAAMNAGAALVNSSTYFDICRFVCLVSTLRITWSKDSHVKLAFKGNFWSSTIGWPEMFLPTTTAALVVYVGINERNEYIGLSDGCVWCQVDS